MKSIFIISSILCSMVFFSCTSPNEQKYLGTWKNKEQKATIKIKKDGDDFVVQTIVDNAVSSSSPFHLTDTCLLNKTSKLDIASITGNIYSDKTSGHLMWSGVEWERQL